LTRSLVVDSSALVALLVDAGPDGSWAADQLTGALLSAPHLAPFEVANVLRRHERAGLVTADQAALAHADLVDLGVELWPYDLLAARAWALRSNLSLYDGAYVALAELTGSTLVTLDRGIAAAPGIRCALATP
jgi:predicted nucleic acid-binding protein